MHEPYVADAAEPPPRPRLERLWAVTVVGAAVVLLLAAGTLFLQGRGEEDPALNAPTPAADS